MSFLDNSLRTWHKLCIDACPLRCHNRSGAGGGRGRHGGAAGDGAATSSSHGCCWRWRGWCRWRWDARRGRGWAALALRVRPRERERARANLALALPELAVGAREALLKRAAAALGANLHDTLALERLSAGGYAGVEGTAAAATARALLAEGRGLLILTGHLGCWELLGGWLARELGGLAVVTGTIHNAPFDRLVNDRRRRLGLTPLPREGDLRPLLRVLRGGAAR